MMNSRDEKVDEATLEIEELYRLYDEHEELRKQNNNISRRSSQKLNPSPDEITRMQEQLGDIPERLKAMSSRISELEEKYHIKPQSDSPSAMQRLSPRRSS